MEKRLDFFLFLGSTYTHLSVHRAERLAARAGVALRWRPFSARTLMLEQNNRPFIGKPVKLAYMWRDLERRARRHGVPFVSIPPYPIDMEELGNRVATVAALEGWCARFMKAAYAAWFLQQRDPGSPQTLTDLLRGMERDPAVVLARADSAEIRDRYAEETATARSMGIFGSPTFACGAEIFWGDDRLEDAIEWCQAPSGHGRTAARA
jgi:2-hydroxychromene-2-carboxylate isomerase